LSITQLPNVLCFLIKDFVGLTETVPPPTTTQLQFNSCDIYRKDAHLIACPLITLVWFERSRTFHGYQERSVLGDVVRNQFGVIFLCTRVQPIIMRNMWHSAVLEVYGTHFYFHRENFITSPVRVAFRYHFLEKQSRDSSVHRLGVRFPAGIMMGFSSFCDCVQTGSGTHPASYPLGTGGLFPW